MKCILWKKENLMRIEMQSHFGIEQTKKNMWNTRKEKKTHLIFFYFEKKVFQKGNSRRFMYLPLHLEQFSNIFGRFTSPLSVVVAGQKMKQICNFVSSFFLCCKKPTTKSQISFRASPSSILKKISSCSTTLLGFKIVDSGLQWMSFEAIFVVSSCC